MKYAIVQSGGNQYRCEEGATVQVQRLAVEPGSPYAFEQVLLVSDGEAVKVGTPNVNGARRPSPSATSPRNASAASAGIARSTPC
jgi:large subunit ribosomal protein L21